MNSQDNHTCEEDTDISDRHIIYLLYYNNIH